MRTRIFWSLADAFVSVALPAISLIILARFLSAAEFGVFSIAFSLVLLATAFIETLFFDALLLSQPNSELESTAHAVAISVAIAFALIGWPLAGMLESWFAVEVSDVMRALLPCVLLSGITAVPSALLFRGAQFRSLVTRTAAARLAATAVGAVSAIAGAGVWALVAAQLASSFVTWVVVQRALRAPIYVALSARTLVPILRTMLLTNTATIFTLTGRRLFFLLAVRGLPLNEVGYADLAFRIFDMLHATFAGIARRLGLPMFMSRQMPPLELMANFWTLTTRTSVIAIAACATFAFLGSEIFSWCFGAAWRPAGQVMLWLGLAAAVLSTRAYVYDLLNVNDRVIWSTTNSVVAFAVLIAGPLVTPVSSASEVGVMWLGAAAVAAGLSFLFASALNGTWEAPQARQFIHIGVGAVIAIGVAYAVRENAGSYGDILSALAFIGVFSAFGYGVAKSLIQDLVAPRTVAARLT